MVNFADVVLDLERRKTAEGPLARGGTLRLVKMGKNHVPSRGYYYEMTPQGIAISTAPPIYPPLLSARWHHAPSPDIPPVLS